ncbi:glycoside hydrolase family 25 protein [Frigidibacter oleivorans]|uniref:glycoside hydrolase family 25 protein n=1 Tax=Frigidibacter oleivorans TaxID=2487129 RepID=UPI000F8F68BA|nr:GH25 family lysozyme [Frigidibacter oleivorans]
MRRTIRAAGCLLLLAVLAACGGGGPKGIPPQFGDSAPHPWTGRAPDDYDVHGIDVSRWQGRIDWNAVRRGGVDFAFIKATEGGDIADPMFQENWARAREAGLPRGAYHFYYFCRTAQEQAAWFISHAPRERGALPPVLDIEWTRSRNCPRRPSPEWIRQESAIFLSILTSYYGQRPVIYTTVDFFRDNEMWRIQGHDFWLRSVAGHPSQVYPGHDWTFWQYSGTGQAQGVAGDVDLNAFGGSRGQWQSWLARRSQ